MLNQPFCGMHAGLAQNKYLEDRAFLNYLKYLEYWRQPKYAQYIRYGSWLDFAGMTVCHTLHCMRVSNCCVCLQARVKRMLLCTPAPFLKLMCCCPLCNQTHTQVPALPVYAGAAAE